MKNELPVGIPDKNRGLDPSRWETRPNLARRWRHPSARTVLTAAFISDCRVVRLLRLKLRDARFEGSDAILHGLLSAKAVVAGKANRRAS